MTIGFLIMQCYTNHKLMHIVLLITLGIIDKMIFQLLGGVLLIKYVKNRKNRCSKENIQKYQYANL